MAKRQIFYLRLDVSYVIRKHHRWSKLNTPKLCLEIRIMNSFWPHDSAAAVSLPPTYTHRPHCLWRWNQHHKLFKWSFFFSSSTLSDIENPLRFLSTDSVGSVIFVNRSSFCSQFMLSWTPSVFNNRLRITSQWKSAYRNSVEENTLTLVRDYERS